MSDANSNITGGPAPERPPQPVTPAAPPPAAPAAKAVARPERRAFLGGVLAGSWLAFAWTTMTASLGLMALGTLRFLFPNVLNEPPSRVKVGYTNRFEEGKVDTTFKDKNFWI